MRDNKRGELPSLSAFLIGKKYKEPGECFSPASVGGLRSRRYLCGLLRIWNLLYKGVKAKMYHGKRSIWFGSFRIYKGVKEDDV
jgi:hypothetical protein